MHKPKNTFTFTDDILIVTKGTKENYLEKVVETFQVLDEAGIRLKLVKCVIAKPETESLGYTLSSEGMKPITEMCSHKSPITEKPISRQIHSQQQCQKLGKNKRNEPETAQVGAISKARKDSKTTFSTTGDNSSSQKTKN